MKLSDLSQTILSYLFEKILTLPVFSEEIKSLSGDHAFRHELNKFGMDNNLITFTVGYSKSDGLFDLSVHEPGERNSQQSSANLLYATILFDSSGDLSVLTLTSDAVDEANYTVQLNEINYKKEIDFILSVTDDFSSSLV